MTEKFEQYVAEELPTKEPDETAAGPVGQDVIPIDTGEEVLYNGHIPLSMQPQEETDYI